MAVPESDTAAWTAYVAAVVFFPAVFVIQYLDLPLHWHLALALAVPAATIICLEAYFVHPARRESTGLQFHAWTPSFGTVGYKLLGFAVVLGTIIFAQYTLSEYTNKQYKSWFVLRDGIGPWACLVCVVYFVAVDGYQTETAKAGDLYHNLGRLLLLQRPTAARISPGSWAQLAMEWLVKAFFLPLMASGFGEGLIFFEEQAVRMYDLFTIGELSFGAVFGFLHDTIFLLDVVWATFGYILSCKLTDSHIQSVETTFFGWFVALCCYPPFNSSVLDSYLAYEGPANRWDVYFKDGPTWVYWLWGSAILVLISIYTWATLVFGVRFSNLTNRGIITAGPYAFTRHPAYIAKNLSWWMTSVPWSLHDGPQMAFKRCLRLAVINLVYYCRAQTEEAHLLSKNDRYRTYYTELQQRHEALRGRLWSVVQGG